MLLSLILTVYLGIHSQPCWFRQSWCVDKRAHQEVPFGLLLRINLVGLEDTEPRVVVLAENLIRPKTDLDRTWNILP
jgi:hypothetical protein